MLSKNIFFMRFWFCNIQCPSFVCFCKPSPHLYTPGPLKLEHSSNGPSKVIAAAAASSEQLSGEGKATGASNEEAIDENNLRGENDLRSSIKRRALEAKGLQVPQKKKVQWIDLVGKELVEVKEFESSDTDERDNDDLGRSCICSIL